MNRINTYQLLAIAAFMLVLTSCKDDAYTPPVNNAPIPRIVELRPERVSAGDTLSIVGLNFAATAEENEVKLNQMPVDILQVSDTVIKVIVPAIDGNIMGVSVRSHGKISNKQTVSLVEVKQFADNFDRDDQSPVGAGDVPNPLGATWQIVAGTFELRSNTLFSDAGGSETYMLYRDPDLSMQAGDGSYFKLEAEVSTSPQSWAGVIFNAQSDNKRFYLLRTANNELQLLKTGNNGLGDWAAIMINQPVEGFAADTRYHFEISSSKAGEIHIKITNKDTGTILFERTAIDPNPYTGGSPGFYYFGLANPVTILFDNFLLETL